MSESLMLSLIFVGIIALIGYIGAKLGVARGFVLTTAIFAGAEAALWWGDRSGNWISDLLGAGAATGRFVAAMTILLLSTLLLGVVASSALTWGTPSRWGASLGGLLGAANGALLIAMALRLYYLAYEGRLTSDPLDDSIVTRVLWQNFDWFVLGFLVLATLLLLYSRFNRLSLTVPDPPARSNLPRPVPPPVPRVRRVEESEPLSATPVSSSRNGVQRQISEAPVDETIYAPQSARAVNPEAPTGRSTTAHAEESRAELPSARNAVRFCPNCGMTLDASDRFCPDCGYTL